ncbi:anaerobic ribonucleoside-triphosphate reductase [Candidatus Woesearchaeota archaeon]|nr:anaerobic ribonucleoside-triphosphate reductase [Candidatus Woesearchaeota archaeon]MBW3021693.1 anaerobic ribonucleoside-triphosphate reductase [Candidatus Woesearchaeota archaeon]
MEKRIITSNGEIGTLSKDKIKQALLKETSISDENAEVIAQKSFDELSNINGVLKTSLIREIVCMKLRERALEREHSEFVRLGIPVYDVHKIMFQYDKNNANTTYNPQTIQFNLAGGIARQYALFHLLPKSISDAHINGEIYIHDFEFFATRPFCFSHDIRFFLKNGLKTDGTGKHTASSGPAKSLAVALRHAARTMIIASNYFSGGQGFDSLNLFLAPYARGLSDHAIEHAVQGFVFQLATLNVVKGGQLPFTSESLELNCPGYLKDVPVVLPGGKVSEKEEYENYMDEARRITKAFTNIMMRGDHLGRPFIFPKPEYKIRKETLKDKEVEPLLMDIHKLVAKFGSPYFLNMAAPYMPDALQSQCCRYFLAPDQDFWEEIKEGTVRSGSIQTVTLNLPNIAYVAGSEDRVFELIQERVNLTKEIFDVKRECIQKVMDSGAAPFLTMDCNGKPYFKIEASTNSLGFIGLNEMLKSLTGEELHENDSAWKLGLKIINFMSELVKEKQEETGQRWGMVQTPAESASWKFAELDLKNFGDKAVVQGNRESKDVFYTNSSQPNYSANIDLFKRLKIDSSFHPLIKGGVISHVFLGETNPDPEALLNLTKKICSQTLTAYYAYTKDITYCNACGKTFGGLLFECPSCGETEKVECFSRITGYYTPVKSWNKGKYKEFLERKRYGLNG